jgi:hypothetical protein
MTGTTTVLPSLPTLNDARSCGTSIDAYMLMPRLSLSSLLLSLEVLLHNFCLPIVVVLPSRILPVAPSAIIVHVSTEICRTNIISVDCPPNQIARCLISAPVRNLGAPTLQRESQISATAATLRSRPGAIFAPTVDRENGCGCARRARGHRSQVTVAEKAKRNSPPTAPQSSQCQSNAESSRRKESSSPTHRQTPNSPHIRIRSFSFNEDRRRRRRLAHSFSSIPQYHNHHPYNTGRFNIYSYSRLIVSSRLVNPILSLSSIVCRAALPTAKEPDQGKAFSPVETPPFTSQTPK